MTASNSVPEALTTYFDSINSEDWDRLATVWQDHAELIPVGARPRAGADEIVEFYAERRASWKQHREDPTRFILAGDTVTAEVHFTGTSVAGVEVEFDAVDVFDLVGGRIQRLTNWYDSAAVGALLLPPIPEAIGAYFRAVNAEDWDGFRTLWAEDSTVLAVGARPRRGVDDVMGLYTKMFNHWPKHRDVPSRTLVDGNTVTVEVHFIGTTEDGRELQFDAVDVFDLEDGQIKKLTNWYDTSRVRAMIAENT
jgi:ketosteroid isomerase-like protein